MSKDPYTTPAAGSGVVSSGEAWVKPSKKELLLSFKGRIPRSQYWVGTLIIALISLVVMAPGFIIFFTSLSQETGEPSAFGWIALGISFLLSLPLSYCSYAILAKRWHDRGKSGWWSLISLIPYVGGFWLLIECGCLKGNDGPNEYGPDPLQ